MRRALGTLALLAVAASAAAAQDSAAVKKDSVTWQPELGVDQVVGIVGTTPILWSDVLFAIGGRLRGQRPPTDPAVQRQLALDVLNQLMDEEVLVQRAKSDTSIKVADNELTQQVDQSYKRVRDQFKTETEFRDVLKREAFGTPDEYRRKLLDDARRQALQERLMAKLRQDGKLLPAVVSDDELAESFARTKGQLPKRPPTVAFRQLAISPQPSEAAKAKAREKILAIADQLAKGGDFEQIAKRESMDDGSKETGGDLGWNRRGRMVPEFDRVMFAMPPGVVSPVVETVFGYHLIRVDRVAPGEVKARHILIRPLVDSADEAKARLRADSVMAKWKAGAAFDSLLAKYHDPREDHGSNEPYDRTQLPPAYQQALEGKGKGDFAGPFAIEDRRTGSHKFILLQVLSASASGEYTLDEFKDRIREQLSQEKSIRRLIDGLRKETYVSIRLGDKLPTPLS